MKSAYDKIAAGLEDAIAYMASDTGRGRKVAVGGKATPAAPKAVHEAEVDGHGH